MVSLWSWWSTVCHRYIRISIFAISKHSLINVHLHVFVTPHIKRYRYCHLDIIKVMFTSSIFAVTATRASNEFLSWIDRGRDESSVWFYITGWCRDCRRSFNGANLVIIGRFLQGFIWPWRSPWRMKLQPPHPSSCKKRDLCIRCMTSNCLCCRYCCKGFLWLGFTQQDGANQTSMVFSLAWRTW